MDNLLNQLQRVFNNSHDWNYYNLPNLTSPFISPEFKNSEQFVKQYLDYSDKTKDIYNVLELLEPYRFLHIATDFFLGILVYENSYKIKRYIDSQIKKITTTNNNSDNSFKYFWFLICFYHDVGYYYENHANLIQSISTLDSDLGIDNQLNKLIGVPEVFHNVKNKYLKYRLEICHVYDHGIVGGILFYDRLIKIYNSYKNIYGQNGFTHRGLSWSDSMLKYFQLIASCVFTHNIWFKNKESDSDSYIYLDYKLDKLVISNLTRKITLERHPFLFLLSLVDTIEPTKRYGINFLNNVRFIFPKKDSIIIALNDYNSQTKEWLEHINTLSSWLKMETNLVKDSHIEFVL